MISTRDLSSLPDILHLQRLLQSLAMLDAILEPEWSYRYYSFNSQWAPDAQMGSMRNGSGDDFHAHFSAAGCWLKGFGHEYPMTPYRDKRHLPWPGVLDHVPAEFASCLSEPAFSVEDTTFCIWRLATDTAWRTGPIEFPNDRDPDGSAFLLEHLDGNPETYRNFADEYFEKEVDLGAIALVYQHEPLSNDLLARIASRAVDAQLLEDVREIGYPSLLTAIPV